jgi:hypothetical protein
MNRPSFDQSTTWPSGFLDTLGPGPLPPPLTPAPDPLESASRPPSRAARVPWWLRALVLLVVAPVALVAALAALPVGLLVLALEGLRRAVRRRRGDALTPRDD